MDDMEPGNIASRDGHGKQPAPGATTNEVLRWAIRRLAASRPWDTGASAHVSPAESPDIAWDERVARGEAQWLMEWATGWSRSHLLIHITSPFPTPALPTYVSAVERRVSGEPVQYIVGYAAFYGRDFTVQPGCLIPRPETEVLVESAIDFVRTYLRGNSDMHPDDGCIVDVGTGSGALAVTLKLECPQFNVFAVDVSQDALDIASVNAARLGAEVTFLKRDALKWLSGQRCVTANPEAHTIRELPRTLRLLVSNPPYIPSLEVEGLSQDVKDHEPRLALDGGPDGLRFYRAFAEMGDSPFAPGPAALFLEVGAGQAEEVRALFLEQALCWPDWAFDVIDDLRGIGRVVRGMRNENSSARLLKS